MRREGVVYVKNTEVGLIWESEDGFGFQYHEDYVQKPTEGPVSKTLPIRKDAYLSKTMTPFFDGLIPEGWYLNIASKNWKLDVRDRMGLLLVLCHDCIGAVSIKKNE